ncbi:MAG: TAT-variant-translocated molybdopterin oxidoreductase [Planctomycetes bacterium]|nr:TAT-variant-translocated molybdopterin oxidoreductase [Planctomycetota bacterium]
MTDLQIRTTPASGAAEKVYWRSFDQLAGTPEFQEILHREFPEGIADSSGLDDPVSRRRFLGVVAASVALAGMTSCRKPEREILPFNKTPEGMIPGLPNHYATALTRGGFGYGVVVRSNDGRPTKIEGNELHPSTNGATDSLLQAEILNFYDPARSKHVRRKGHEAPAGAGDHADHATAAAHPTNEDFRSFWSEHLKSIAGRAGEGLHVLMPPTTSPTLLRLVEMLRGELGKVRFHSWSPLGIDSVLEGTRLAFGRGLMPQYDFAAADVVASFDSDFLGADAPTLAWTRGWAASRRITEREGRVSRLWVAEATHTLTGSNADHRHRMSSTDVGLAVLALAGQLLVGGDPLHSVLSKFTGKLFADGKPSWLQSLAEDLKAAGGRCCVVVGPRQPLLIQAIGHAINVQLGAVAPGMTVSYVAPPAGIDRGVTFGDIVELATAMKAGKVDTLVCLDANPLYDAPADLGIAEAFAQVPHTIHAGLWVDETALESEWHIPLSHELEQWSDTVAYDGTPSVVQPLIAPLHAPSRSPIELIVELMGESKDAWTAVRETWQERAPAGQPFESFWKKTLHDGVLPRSASSDVPTPPIDLIALKNALVAHTPAVPPSRDALEVVFRPCPKLWDGRYANNSWQQETPSPVERLTWDNAVLVSRKTAGDLGVANSDVVRVTVDGRSVEGAIWIQPGHADDCVTLTLGYGRRMDPHCEVAAGRGYDAYRVRTSTAPWTALGARVEKTGATYRLVVTQEHGTMEGRPLVRENTLAGFRSTDWKATDESPLGQMAKLHGHGQQESDLTKSLFVEQDYSTGYRWGMVIDLNTCTGCGACVTACVAENNIPMVGKESVSRNREMFWNRVDRYFEGVDTRVGLLTIQEPTDDPKVVYQMVPCMQCENAPCESVCPVAATTHTAEGLNDMVYNRCIGTRYCSNNCPYKVRRFNWFAFNSDNAPERKMQFNPDVTVRARGVMEKCTYCVQRINAGKFRAKVEARKLKDLADIKTACQQVCPAEAVTFGDLNDKDSRVAKLAQSPLNYAMLADLNVKPRTTYLAKIRNPRTES